VLISHRESNVFGQSALGDVGEGLVGAPALNVLGHLGVRALALVYACVFLQRVMLQKRDKQKFQIGRRGWLLLEGRSNKFLSCAPPNSPPSSRRCQAPPRTCRQAAAASPWLCAHAFKNKIMIKLF